MKIPPKMGIYFRQLTFATLLHPLCIISTTTHQAQMDTNSNIPPILSWHQSKTYTQLKTYIKSPPSKPSRAKAKGIIILSGDPGSGKRFLVRHFMHLITKHSQQQQQQPPQRQTNPPISPQNPTTTTKILFVDISSQNAFSQNIQHGFRINSIMMSRNNIPAQDRASTLKVFLVGNIDEGVIPTDMLRHGLKKFSTVRQTDPHSFLLLISDAIHENWPWIPQLSEAFAVLYMNRPLQSDFSKIISSARFFEEITTHLSPHVPIRNSSSSTSWPTNRTMQAYSEHIRRNGKALFHRCRGNLEKVKNDLFDPILSMGTIDNCDSNRTRILKLINRANTIISCEEVNGFFNVPRPIHGTPPPHSRRPGANKGIRYEKPLHSILLQPRISTYTPLIHEAHQKRHPKLLPRGTIIHIPSLYECEHMNDDDADSALDFSNMMVEHMHNRDKKTQNPIHHGSSPPSSINDLNGPGLDLNGLVAYCQPIQSNPYHAGLLKESILACFASKVSTSSPASTPSITHQSVELMRVMSHMLDIYSDIDILCNGSSNGTDYRFSSNQDACLGIAIPITVFRRYRQDHTAIFPPSSFTKLNKIDYPIKYGSKRTSPQLSSSVTHIMNPELAPHLVPWIVEAFVLRWQSVDRINLSQRITHAILSAFKEATIPAKVPTNKKGSRSPPHVSISNAFNQLKHQFFLEGTPPTFPECHLDGAIVKLFQAFLDEDTSLSDNSSTFHLMDDAHRSAVSRALEMIASHSRIHNDEDDATILKMGDTVTKKRSSLLGSKRPRPPSSSNIPVPSKRSPNSSSMVITTPAKTPTVRKTQTGTLKQSRLSFS